MTANPDSTLNDATTYRTRWADMDPNGHMRHSAYADYAADQRLVLLAGKGYDIKEFARLRLGPILFREETTFLKEISIGEHIQVNSRLRSVSDDGGRWSIMHTIFKADGRVAATVAVDGAWLDLDQRKLTTPPVQLAEAFRHLPAYEAPVRLAKA